MSGEESRKLNDQEDREPAAQDGEAAYAASPEGKAVEAIQQYTGMLREVSAAVVELKDQPDRLALLREAVNAAPTPGTLQELIVDDPENAKTEAEAATAALKAALVKAGMWGPG